MGKKTLFCKKKRREMFADSKIVAIFAPAIRKTNPPNNKREFTIKELAGGYKRFG